MLCKSANDMTRIYTHRIKHTCNTSRIQSCVLHGHDMAWTYWTVSKTWHMPGYEATSAHTWLQKTETPLIIVGMLGAHTDTDTHPSDSCTA
jgi:hypothetical protein